MNKSQNGLSMEQEFSHQLFSASVKQLSREDAQDLLVQMHQHMLCKDNLYKKLFLGQEQDIVDSLLENKNN